MPYKPMLSNPVQGGPWKAAPSGAGAPPMTDMRAVYNAAKA